MFKAFNKNQNVIEEFQKNVVKKPEVSLRPSRIPFDDEYSDPSDLDISIDFEPDVAYGEMQLQTKEDVKEPESTLNEFKPMILSNLLETEGDFMPLETELSIKSKHKFALIDWIIRIHQEFGFADDTLISSIDLFGRICKARKIKRCHYQLFAATSLWIASKLEETQTPALSDFIYLCDDSYQENEFTECERAFCASLGFNMYGPTARSFILAITSDKKYEKITRVAEFFLHIALMCNTYSETEPSIVALTCIYLAILATESSTQCIDETEELIGIDAKEVCSFAISVIATYSIVFESATEELKSIFLKEIGNLPVSLPSIDDEFVRKIKVSDLKSLL